MKIIFGLLATLSAVMVSAQNLDIMDLRKIHNAFSTYLSSQETMNEEQRKSEFIICFLELNNEGSVKKINLMADDQNKDLTFRYLNQMPLSTFDSVRLEKCKNKIIVVPIISSGKDDLQYISKLKKQFPPAKRVSVEKETDILITISPVQYSIPISK